LDETWLGQTTQTLSSLM